MKRMLLTMLCLFIATVVYADENCISREKEFYGSRYFNKCHCETLSYPDVVEAMKPLDVDAKPRWVACTTLDGEEWCVCGVRLSWTEQPEDKNVCEARKKEAKELGDKFVELKKDFGVSAPLICR